MNTLLVTTILPLVILLVFSAFFSASETAFSSISKVQLRQLKKSKNRSDKRIVKILARPERMLNSVLIGNNIVNTWASSIATAFAISVFGNSGVGIATLVMTAVIILFSESTPKTLAAQNPLGTARRFSPIVSVFLIIMRPLSAVFSAVNTLFIKVLKFIMPDSGHSLTEDELRTIMTVGKDEGVLEEDEHNLLNRAFDFTDLKLKEIMTPRTNIIAVSVDTGLREIYELFRVHQFSRIPAYENTIDNVLGMIHYKDILFSIEKGKKPAVKELIRPVLFVPETQSTYDLLYEMDQHCSNMAIVVDEHGATVGLVTIDDAIAAVFGTINDEYDRGAVKPYEKVQVFSAGHIRVPGDLKLDDLNALLKTSFDSEYFETVGGFVMELAGKLPEAGEVYHNLNADFKIYEQHNRKILRVDIFLHS
ncbi:hemolysin family protein [Brucepastera parasyntrophica]|uniref:hemolysin family protein n=1 Tax=Brucepastera parasyntrophica TaxID=2880008 RepID=UPI002108D3EB|nr:hemolysin family protein [Brucepastera parasyntrophica]ULQ58847.1 hemolysin family protein [Brucepastera parasyntrophica]